MAIKSKNLMLSNYNINITKIPRGSDLMGR